MVEVVFFDVGGTLLRPDPSVGEVYAEVASRHGVDRDPSVLESAFHRAWEDATAVRRASKPSSDEKGFWVEIVRRTFGDLADFRDFDSFFEDLYRDFAGGNRWKLFPETLEVLTGLRAEGRRLAVLSNWDSRLPEILASMGLAPFFEQAFFSGQDGVAKPDPGIFRRALAGMGVDPARCVHVGDHLVDDVRGASAVGIRPFWVNRHGLSRPAEAVATGLDLSSFLEFVRSLS